MRWVPRSTRNKYGAIKQPPCPACGYRHDSKREAQRCGVLALAERAGAICALRRQVRYSLEVNGQHIADYVADFVYQSDGATVVEDSKGWATREYKLKAKLLHALYDITVRET